ncbi:prepilin-type N-terminal cleavage/methylation domain-containing protein [Microbacterium sp. NPDC096154]|uniref:prepilin-type N-terminal cleavage/methylation domain-containing protein n=1 Tax=Microbacterium sp. NPDC096154 TaxID=3155549 RepID=UPI00332C016D
MRDPHDDGFTLVELLVYVLLLGVILAAGFGLLVNSLRGSTLVMASTAASRDGQTVARTINESIRNATHVTVSSDGRFFVAATPSHTCHGWYAEGDGDVFARISATKIPRPTGHNPSGWMHIASSISPGEGDSRIFIQSGSGVAVRFTVATATSPTLVETVSTPRLSLSGVNPCAV